MEDRRKTAGSLALQEKQPRVITIEATQPQQAAKLRVAAYARVSSSSDDQLNSFGAQNRYYTDYITSQENWSLVDVYADEGITGTSAEKRKDFQRMLADCRRGKIDRILVKSISRFARNTKECLETVRELKSLGVSVFFEEQNIDTGLVSSETMTAIFASLAQKESESISANLRWSYKRRMERGEFNTCRAPYGYRLDNGKLIIQEDEAKIIREIFMMYLSGMQSREIARHLTNTTARKWGHESIEYALQNERYAGNALLKKRYTTDVIPRKTVKNNGESEMYYIENINDPIISKEEFEKARCLREYRASRMQIAPNPQILSQKVQCMCCGKWMRPRTTNDKRYISCRTHETNISACTTTQVPEEQIFQAFCRFYYKLKHNSDILSQMLLTLQTIRNRRMLWSPDIIELNKKISDVTSQVQMLAMLNQQSLVDPDIFISKNNELTEQLHAIKLEKERLMGAEDDGVIHQTQELIGILESGPDFLPCFDAELFGELVDKIVVESNERLRFHLKNGLELSESIERTVR